MSDISLTDNIDTKELVSSLDYEDLFEGTELEDELDFGDEKSFAESLGGAIGAFVGRRIGEMLARQVQEAVTESLSRDEAEEETEAEDEQAEGEEAEAEEEDAEEGEEPEEVDSIPDSPDELADLSYRQLQSLAKARDIQANLSREELTQELSQVLEIEA